MGLFDLFKKKKEQIIEIARINSYFYGIIVTKTPYEINKDKFISFDEVKSTIYKDMNYFFFTISELQEYLRVKMKDTQYFDKIYFYSVCIQPITEDMQDLTAEVFENKFPSINIDLYKDNSLKIAFIDDFTNTLPVNLMPGIRSIDDLNECLSNLYTRVFNKKLKPRVYDILKEEEKNEKFDFDIINVAKNTLDEGEIINIFYNNYPKGNWVSSFTKDLIDHMLMKQKLNEYYNQQIAEELSKQPITTQDVEIGL